MPSSFPERRIFSHVKSGDHFPAPIEPQFHPRSRTSATCQRVSKAFTAMMDVRRLFAALIEPRAPLYHVDPDLQSAAAKSTICHKSRPSRWTSRRRIS